MMTFHEFVQKKENTQPLLPHQGSLIYDGEKWARRARPATAAYDKYPHDEVPSEDVPGMFDKPETEPRRDRNWKPISSIPRKPLPKPEFDFDDIRQHGFLPDVPKPKPKPKSDDDFSFLP